MSSVSLHAASAPTFLQYLNNLTHWLDKAQAHAAAKSFDAETLLAARLAPDMLPLSGQMALATAFAKNAMCRLAQRDPPDFPDVEKTIADHRARIARAIAIVESVAPTELEGAGARTLVVRMGPDVTATMNGQDYLFRFALPNFWFHTTAAYAILRHNGVDLGKRDFMTGAGA
ncbi:MAG: DUF1993 domain-containing protein [Hyphomonadaceae bacterium]|nr:DUF1993 domain-containing protein [Hyphomonadaceae bacterium]